MTLRFSLSILLLFGFGLQTTGSAIHQILHAAENFSVAQGHDATIDEQGCTICDALQARDVPSASVTLTASPLEWIQAHAQPTLFKIPLNQRLPGGPRAPPRLTPT